MTTRGLIILPFIECLADTREAVHDALQQLEHTADILLVDQGSTDTKTLEWETRIAADNPRVRLWRHCPPLPSLAATWNRALDYAWEAGYPDAMVWNNDVRVRAGMYEDLRIIAAAHALWFTTPVNCALAPAPAIWQVKPEHLGTVTLGGPDFSCFLITPECHGKYRFDERFIKAYFEDNQYVRHLWLGGDGRKIASCTLPYLHYGSRTSQRSPEAAAELAPFFEHNRALYIRLWGGPPHHEQYLREGDPTSACEGIGTPGGVPGDAPSSAIPDSTAPR